ncbi:MAG: recombination protein RecR [Pelagibacteraceae bacterium TMED233]|nr:MAG: recombination protein RecR [Pelagibacteraceae bacterium TMED233]|tara:strand:+ start:464 stop:1072 length:609 start_codon:yes stop_codon:yes gene_type:complete
MTNNIPEIDDLIKLISKLPGLGSKSSKRIVLRLINSREELIKPLANTLAKVYKNVQRCRNCGNLKSLNDNCICSQKNYNQICVVENLSDMFVIEGSGIYKGHYHILGGTLSMMDSKKEEDLLIPALINRAKNNSIDEIILALSASVEGATTAHYIQDNLKNLDVKISKLAQGIPVGGEIEFLDDGTLFSAFKNRKNINNSEN